VIEVAISVAVETFDVVEGGAPPPAYSPSLDFSDHRNSQYVPVIFF
jgi:hypothetical protein